MPDMLDADLDQSKSQLLIDLLGRGDGGYADFSDLELFQLNGWFRQFATPSGLMIGVLDHAVPPTWS